MRIKVKVKTIALNAGFYGLHYLQCSLLSANLNNSKNKNAIFVRGIQIQSTFPLFHILNFSCL